MLSPELARRLEQAGLVWSPAPGDRFVVPDRDLDDEVFVLSDMVIERLDLPDVGAVLAFNGTTEWALDSLEAAEALWLPREDQLRELLGERFVALERVSLADVRADVPTYRRYGPTYGPRLGRPGGSCGSSSTGARSDTSTSPRTRRTPGRCWPPWPRWAVEGG